VLTGSSAGWPAGVPVTVKPRLLSGAEKRGAGPPARGRRLIRHQPPHRARLFQPRSACATASPASAALRLKPNGGLTTSIPQPRRLSAQLPPAPSRPQDLANAGGDHAALKLCIV
jgi:hypothetical protein